MASSLPPLSLPKLSDAIKTESEESTQSFNECNYSIVTSDELSSNTNSPLNSNNDIKSNSHKRLKTKGPFTLTYGPIHVTLRRSVAPTLATGRCSKFMKLEGDAAIKRELRRQKNREAAKKLKEKRNNIEQELETKIQELESKEQDLLFKIKYLESYREYLKIQYIHNIAIREKLAQKAYLTLEQIKYNQRGVYQSVPIYHIDTNIQEEREPRPSSPQWQLLFSI